jgi:uncharacterized membrane protein
MRRAIAKAVTWRLIGTAEIFAISFWTTGHAATAGHTAGIAAISSVFMYVIHELAWDKHEVGSAIPTLSTRPTTTSSILSERVAVVPAFSHHAAIIGPIGPLETSQHHARERMIEAFQIEPRPVTSRHLALLQNKRWCCECASSFQSSWEDQEADMRPFKLSLAFVTSPDPSVLT